MYLKRLKSKKQKTKTKNKNNRRKHTRKYIKKGGATWPQSLTGRKPHDPALVSIQELQQQQQQPPPPPPPPPSILHINYQIPYEINNRGIIFIRNEPVKYTISKIPKDFIFDKLCKRNKTNIGYIIDKTRITNQSDIENINPNIQPTLIQYNNEDGASDFENNLNYTYNTCSENGWPISAEYLSTINAFVVFDDV